jgi:hypothetical protein
MKNLIVNSSVIIAPLFALFSFNTNTANPSYSDIDSLDIWDNGSPASKTGAPGEGTCTQCHSGSTMSATGVVSAVFDNGTTASYMPGQTYDISISSTGSATNGFQMTSLTSSNAAAGDFTSGINSSLTTGGGKKYINHSASSGVSSWTFQWTAPNSNVGDVIFYYAYNKSNSNGSTSGDQIYLGNFTITPSTSLSVNESQEKMEPLIFLYERELRLDYALSSDKKVYVSIQTLEGKMAHFEDLGVQNSGRHQEGINIPSNLQSGVYLVTVFVDNQGFSKKLFIQ